jgi:ABC-type phosphate/phosphonate transport system substrate-binding protein
MMASSKTEYILIYPLSTLLLLFILTGCGAQEEIVVPTSTPQPPVLAMLIAAEEVEEGDIAALESELFRRTNLVIDIQTVARTSEALRTLCAVNETPAAAWLDALTYAAAQAQNCGQAYLQVARDTAQEDVVSSSTEEAAATAEIIPTDEILPTEEAQATDEPLPSNFLTGQSGAIVVNREIGATDLNVVEGRTFCRIDIRDFYSWLLPTLMFDAAGVDLTAGDVTIVEYDENGTMLEAVAAGDCTMAGVSQSVVDEGLPEGVQVAQTSVNFPFEVLVYPLEMDSGTRQTINNALLEISDDRQTAPLLTPLFGRAALLPASSEDFNELNDFLASTGLDFGQLGE